MLTKIISGGQTGVDRAALDAAIEVNFPCGGWCPKGRRAEDGVIPEQYPLRETKSLDYPSRTEKNVEDSDATLIITKGKPTGGTAYTIEVAQEKEKPYLIIDLEEDTEDEAVKMILSWVKREDIQIMNVAGPRASKVPGIYECAKSIIAEVIKRKTR